ncbi:MAG: hypothetical protein MJE68_27490, partial [Proteobacteria bacterium]|nr:hypothetical protein [Pseudomonadota bacterium]
LKLLEINANLRYSLKRVLANLKKSEWQASEKYLNVRVLSIVRGVASVSREEGSGSMERGWVAIYMTDYLKKAVNFTTFFK